MLTPKLSIVAGLLGIWGFRSPSLGRLGYGVGGGEEGIYLD